MKEGLFLRSISLFLLMYAIVALLVYIVSIVAPDLLNYIVYFAIALLIVITGYLIKFYFFRK